MAAPDVLVQATNSWARLYGESPLVATAVRYLHLAGLLLAGGVAVAADRATLVACRAGETTRAAALATLGSSHRVVVSGLACVFVSGALMAASDVETYWGLRVFWVKMLLVAVLLANGLLLRQAEAVAAAGIPSGWRRLRASAIASVVLWLAVVLASTILGGS